MTVIGPELILIKIALPNAGETFNKIQHSVIDTVQALLGANSDGETVTLDAKTAKSMCVMLETLRATLVDARDVQAAMLIASQIMPPYDPDGENVERNA